jgi:outer membrane lipoprotein-sorting protein
MKKTITIIAFLIAVLSFSGLTQEITLDTLLSWYNKAIGTATIKDWKTVVMKGKTIAQGMELPLTIYMKRPGKIRVEVEIQGNKMLQVFDGQYGWSVIPWSGTMEPQDMTPDEVKGMKQQAEFEGSLFNWKEKGHKLELIGKEDMDGTPVYKLKAILANENTDIFYLDAESYVPIKVASIMKIQGNEVESESLPSNYKPVEGAMMPFAMENKYKGQTISSLVLQTYEINTAVDDNLFTRPPKK